MAVFFSKDGFACSCNKNECDECMTKYLITTNADRIRSMTDTELEEWLTAFVCSNVAPYATARRAGDDDV